jgi:hypothetical protein
MNLSIFKSLKDNFVNATSQNNRSTVELCITELSSGNFPKAIDLSEELIKKDINESIGWATKALSQAHLFDYQNNLFLLKSSLTSLEEFKSKTSLSQKEILTVESIFITTILDRTITVVNERVEEVIELRRKAMVEKNKATASVIGAVMSAYAGSQSKSDVGKILGYGGAIAGAAASSHFTSNAELLNSASKGVFGVAVANISLTVGSAIYLKRNLGELEFDVRNEATTSLQNWISTLTFLYQQVIENLIVYGEELKKKNVFTKSFREASINMVNAPEATQFIYLSKILGIENSIPQFKELESQLISLRNTNESEIKSAVKEMHIIGGAILVLAAIAMSIEDSDKGGEPVVGPILYFVLAAVYVYFWFKPLGKAGELKQSVNEFANAVKNFKVTSDRIIVENMIPQDKL